MLNLIAILLVMTAAFSYVNHRYLKCPMTIGVMTIALVLSLAIVGLDRLGFATPHGHERDVILTLTYSVVLFSILVQGLTVGRLARRFCLGGDGTTAGNHDRH